MGQCDHVGVKDDENRIRFLNVSHGNRTTEI